MEDTWVWVVGMVIAMVSYLVWRGPSPEKVAKKVADAAERGDETPFAAVYKMNGDQARKIKAFEESHRLLVFYDLHDHAREAVERARRMDAKALPELAAELAFEKGDTRAGLEALLRLMADEPNNPWHRVQVAETYLALDRIDEAEAVVREGPADWPELRLTAARLALARGHDELALRLAAQVRDEQQALAKRAMVIADISGAENLMGQAAILADAIRASLSGEEHVILDAARRGALDPNAGINYQLLGQAAMAKSTGSPSALRLSASEEAVDTDAPRPGLTGALDALREGRLPLAKKLFQSVLAEHPESWPAMLGLGAAMVQAESWAGAVVDSFAEPATDLDDWLPVVPDLPMLNARERKILSASVRPFWGALEGLIQAQAQIRILPIDVRPTDLPEMSHLAEERLDNRPLRGIAGLATLRLACSRIEDFGDVASAGSWVFAHELAHLVFFHMPERQRAEVEGLFESALQTTHVGGDYQRGNADEFFAVGCEAFLHTVHRSKHAPELDDLGITRGLFQVFQALERAPQD